MKKYRIIQSTVDKYLGVEFEAEDICCVALQNAINHILIIDKIYKEREVYVYSDGHITLLIKEVT